MCCHVSFEICLTTVAKSTMQHVCPQLLQPLCLQLELPIMYNICDDCI